MKRKLATVIPTESVIPAVEPGSNHSNNKKGFTLIEVLISMTIFVTFISIMINSYTSIVRGQREANDYRVMYAEARNIFDTLVREFRDGMVDYGEYSDSALGIWGGQSDIILVSKDATTKTRIYLNGEDLKINKYQLPLFGDPNDMSIFDSFEDLQLNNKIKVTNFKIYVTPAIDPYDPKYITYDVNQFHPMVTIYAKFSKEISPGKEPFVIDMQTSVSSRIYNQVYPIIDYSTDEEEA
ncbi:PilW family protein [Patescibacteria group bacterium]